MADKKSDLVKEIVIRNYFEGRLVAERVVSLFRSSKRSDQYDVNLGNGEMKRAIGYTAVLAEIRKKG